MSTVNIDKLAHVLTFSWTFTDDRAHVLEQVLLEELVKLLWWALNILVQFGCKTLAEDQGISKWAIVSRSISQKHKQKCIECSKFVSRLVKSQNNVFDIKLELLNEVESKMIGQLMHTWEEGKHKVVFNLDLSELGIVSFTADKFSDLLLKDINNCLVRYRSSFLVWINARVDTASGNRVIMVADSLVGIMLITGIWMFITTRVLYISVTLTLMALVCFFLCTNLSDILVERSNTDVSNFDTLIVIDFKLFRNNLRRSLNGQWLLRTSLRLIHHGMFFLLGFFIFSSQLHILFHIKHVLSLAHNLIVLLGLFVQFNWWKQLSLSQESVDLSDKL